MSNKHNYSTIISSKAEILGDIKVTGGLSIEGRVKGNIFAEAGSKAVVRITEKGYVEGEIQAPVVIINGKVTGNVYSTEFLELHKEAEVTGDVHYSMMEMVKGAKVNGGLLFVDGKQVKKDLKSTSKDDALFKAKKDVSAKNADNKEVETAK